MGSKLALPPPWLLLRCCGSSASPRAGHAFERRSRHSREGAPLRPDDRGPQNPLFYLFCSIRHSCSSLRLMTGAFSVVGVACHATSSLKFNLIGKPPLGQPSENNMGSESNYYLLLTSGDCFVGKQFIARSSPTFTKTGRLSMSWNSQS
jgi:hypothetical protein